MFTRVHIYRLDFGKVSDKQITATVMINRMTCMPNEMENIIERECALNMIIVCYNK